jgi:hypothetical protein
VSPLYLYAVLGAAPAGPLGEGMVGETLRLLDCAGVVAAAGEMTASPALDATALRAHDTVVRRLAAIADPLLPARFGTLAATDADLCERLTRTGQGLRDALARVTGREQMILRVYVSEPAATSPPAASLADDVSGDLGPGARYLAERARVQRASSEVSELAPLRPVLDQFVAAERVERHQAPPLVASVYHLLARGTAAAYLAAVEEAARDLPGIRVTVSGPWAPYAFAPERL